MNVEYGYTIILVKNAWQLRLLRDGQMIDYFLYRFGREMMRKEQAFEEAIRAGQGFVAAQYWWDDTMYLRDRTSALLSKAVSETRQ